MSSGSGRCSTGSNTAPFVTLPFAVPAAVRWALPLYELALMTARQAREREAHVEISFVTHESAPLFDLGDAASDRIAELLADAGIELWSSAGPRRPSRTGCCGSRTGR